MFIVKINIYSNAGPVRTTFMYIRFCQNLCVLHSNPGPGKSTLYPPLSQYILNQCWPWWEVNIIFSNVKISATFMATPFLVCQCYSLHHHNQTILHDDAGPDKSTFYPFIVTISASFMTMLALVNQYFILHCHNQCILHDNAGPGKSTFYPPLSQSVHPSWQCWPW